MSAHEHGASPSAAHDLNRGAAALLSLRSWLSGTRRSALATGRRGSRCPRAMPPSEPYMAASWWRGRRLRLSHIQREPKAAQIGVARNEGLSRGSECGSLGLLAHLSGPHPSIDLPREQLPEEPPSALALVVWDGRVEVDAEGAHGRIVASIGQP